MRCEAGESVLEMGSPGRPPPPPRAIRSLSPDSFRYPGELGLLRRGHSEYATFRHRVPESAAYDGPTSGCQDYCFLRFTPCHICDWQRLFEPDSAVLPICESALHAARQRVQSGIRSALRYSLGAICVKSRSPHSISASVALAAAVPRIPIGSHSRMGSSRGCPSLHTRSQGDLRGTDR